MSYTYAAPRPAMIPRPSFGLLGLGISACGMIALWSLFAPASLEQAIPGWRDRFGILIAVGVTFGVFLAVLRLSYRLVGLGFWLVAAYAVTRLYMPGIGGAVTQQKTTASSAPSTISAPFEFASWGGKGGGGSRLGSAVPDAAYFPNRNTGPSLPPAISRILGKRL